MSKLFPPKARTYSHVTHVIFDLDGTIIDSESIYNDIYVNIAEKYGKDFNTQARLSVTGTVELDVGRWMTERFDLPITPKEFDNQVQWQARDKLRKPPLKPGAEKLIRHLNKHSVPICVATSSGEESFQTKTASYSELFSLFHHIVTASSDPEVVYGKPAPDIFLVAAKRFPVPADPKKCLVFEDSPNGVRGAKSAGMQVVMIPEEYCSEDNTREATLVIQSFEVFDPEMFGLPGYPDEKEEEQPASSQSKEEPKSSSQTKEEPKSLSPTKEEPKPSSQTKKEPKPSSQSKQERKSSSQTKKEPKSSSQSKQERKSSSQNKKERKSSSQTKKERKSSPQTKQEPKSSQEQQETEHSTQEQPPPLSSSPPQPYRPSFKHH